MSRWILVATTTISGLMWLQVWIIAGIPQITKAQINSAVNLAIFTTFMIGGIIGPALFMVDQYIEEMGLQKTDKTEPTK